MITDNDPFLKALKIPARYAFPNVPMKNVVDAGSLYMIDEVEDYGVSIHVTGNVFRVVIGHKNGHPGSKFTHPLIISNVEKEFEFKHSRRNGSKYYTRAKGREIAFLIPASEVTILPVKGYSNVAVRINGAVLWFSVSGGTLGTIKGWRDRLGTHVHTAINLPIRTLKKISEVAIAP